MAKKGPMPVYATVDDYIANQPIEAKVKLNEIRALITEYLPNAKELSNVKAPTYSLGSNGKKETLLMMAAYAKFIGFYPFEGTLLAFSERLQDYKLGKGSVQFPLNKPLPTDLIIEMIQYREKGVLGSLD